MTTILIIGFKLKIEVSWQVRLWKEKVKTRKTEVPTRGQRGKRRCGLATEGHQGGGLGSRREKGRLSSGPVQSSPRLAQESAE